MIDLQDLRAQPQRYQTAARLKRIDVDIDRLTNLDAQHRQLLTKRQQLAAEKNQIGKQIGQLAGQIKKASGSDQPALQEKMRQLQQRPAELKDQEQQLDAQIILIEPQLRDLLLHVPQPADDEVPVGQDETQNVQVNHWGQPRRFSFGPKDHIELGTSLGMIDIPRGVNCRVREVTY